MLRTFCVLAGLATTTACTEPTYCTTNLSTAFTLSVRAPGGGADISDASQLDVTQNGAALPQSMIQHRVTGSAATGPIIVYGSGGAYQIIVHHAAYRDTTLTANVPTGACGPLYPPVELTVVLTPL